MADIKTEKHLALLNDPAPSNINIGVDAGIVKLDVKNECVTHFCVMDVNEATRLGVALIQLSAQAVAMAQHEEARRKSNGIVPMGIRKQ